MKKTHVLLLVMIFAIVTVMVPAVFAAGKSCENRVNNNHNKLLECVTPVSYTHLTLPTSDLV